MHPNLEILSYNNLGGFFFPHLTPPPLSYTVLRKPNTCILLFLNTFKEKCTYEGAFKNS